MLSVRPCALVSLASLIIFAVATNCFGVGNRVFESLEELRKIGFEFTETGIPPSEPLFSFEFKVPKEFKIGDEIGSKPFAGVAFIDTVETVEHGPRLIGSPATRLPIETRKTKDGHHESCVTVHSARLENCYIEVMFVHDESGQCPMLVHVPIAAIVQQLKGERRDARSKPK
jgi:hypothetical protein